MTREEAIKKLKVFAPMVVDDTREAIDMAIEALQAEPKTGEWIDVENEPYCECSVCGAYIDNLDDDYAFCPRCGADMRGDTE